MTFIVVNSALLCLLMVVGSHRNFVVTAPLSGGVVLHNDPIINRQDTSVEELESLKQHLLDENNIKNIKAEKTQHEIPITEDTTKEANKQSLETPMETGNTVDNSEVMYSPLDMAEYVFWTGDEKGVTQTIEEFLQEGLMSREEAISFLQEIKYDLDYLKNHYTQSGLNSRGPINTNKGKETLQNYRKYSEKILPTTEKPTLRRSFDINQFRQEMNVKREPLLAVHPTQFKNLEINHDEDYDELLERLRVADFLYTEYSLEEVIYQLAKVMFTQSLTKGSEEAQKALQKFTDFLELEAKQGHISRALEKRVLDVLIASLSDTLNEHPELLSGEPTQDGSSNQSYFLKQMLENVPSRDKSRTSFSPFNNNNNKKGGEMKSKSLHQVMNDRMKEKKMGIHLPLGLGKYKNP